MASRKKTDFSERVLSVVRAIPPGRTFSYKDVARLAGRPRAWRAVGNILSSYDITKHTLPCHRVVRSDLPAPRPGRYFVYAIHCHNDAIYIGQTSDLQKRWRQHCGGIASDYTRRYGANRIVHYEWLRNKKQALRRERWLKTGFGRMWLKREWKAGRTRQAGGKIGGYRWGIRLKARLLKRERAIP